MKSLLTILLLITFTTIWSQKQTLRIATWNIEHLGSAGRGFPEIKKQLPARTSSDFQMIAALIKDTLTLDIVAVQEISITGFKSETAYSKELYQIISYLGSDWKYYLAKIDTTERETEMQNAFIYNTNSAHLSKVFEMNINDFKVGAKSIFDRVPLVGYFKATNPKVKNEDFLIVNLHLASGQDNDENHIVAMIMVEQNLNEELKAHGISTREYDRIILGDFNDNPYLKDETGNNVYLPTLYNYMKLKGYKDYVDETFQTTRMSKNMNSIIDHILVKENLQENIPSSKATIYKPDVKNKSTLNNWRSNYSDHFPISIEIDFN
ncbi:endonuclease/exonuclease/phosphatase family protein [Plebeiibacterium marinum]|uniref:Endonuclease/exonuclease/phosphatase domain-containing protein n=1 Tax=Plebeiibacterium marinum TaxID=2992111 RepID=A0AAE3MG75_9BACT|nr:endonuclease/exonuclease/phosphatase family protein [Plebeiobacterium marinum]MCW3807057.1 hypothetical protein [Plebeiobacterium marinum]